MNYYLSGRCNSVTPQDGVDRMRTGSLLARRVRPGPPGLAGHSGAAARRL